MPWLILRLLGLGSWLKQAAQAVFGWAVRNPAWALLIVAVLWGAREHHGKLKAERYAETEHAARLAQKAAVDAATAAAKAKQAAQDADIAAVQAERNRRTNDVVAQVEKARVDAVAAYVAGHRVRANAVCGSPATAAAVSGDPGGTAQGLPDPELVAISRPDLDSLTQGALQGAAARAYLQSLIDSGQAVGR